MKTTKWFFWASTIILFLFEGMMPLFTVNSQLAIDGIKHLGYPGYFRVMLVIFKVLGALVLIVPQAGWRLKEWAYAGFAINLISAAVSHACVDGLGAQFLFPIVFLAILIVSYLSYHKLRTVPPPGSYSYA
jgi:hypothetical protein